MNILPSNIAVLDGDSHASKWVREQGDLLYDPTIRKVLMPLLKPGDVVVDAGAMIGCYSRGFKDAVGETGSVISFEPNPESYGCLIHNCPDVLCFNSGLSDRHEWLARWTTDNVGKTHFVTPEEAEKTYVFEPLDNYCFDPMDKLNLIKIDVEGMEPKVILGAKKTIERFRPIIFMEINHKALNRYGFHYTSAINPLLEMGYKPHWYGEAKDYSPSQLDVLMMP